MIGQFEHGNRRKNESVEKVEFDITELTSILDDSSGSEKRTKTQSFYRALKYNIPIIPERDADTTEEEFRKEEDDVLTYIFQQKDRFGADERDLRLVIVAKILDAIKYADIRDISWFRKKFEVDLESIPKVMLVPYISEGVATALKRNDLESYEEMKNIFSLEKEAIADGVAIGYAESMQKGWYQITRFIYKTLGKEYKLTPPSPKQYEEGLISMHEAWYHLG